MTDKNWKVVIGSIHLQEAFRVREVLLVITEQESSGIGLVEGKIVHSVTRLCDRHRVPVKST